MGANLGEIMVLEGCQLGCVIPKTETAKQSMFAMLLGCCSGNSFTLPDGRFHWPSEQKKWIQTDTFDAEDKEGLSSCLDGFCWFVAALLLST